MNNNNNDNNENRLRLYYDDIDGNSNNNNNNCNNYYYYNEQDLSDIFLNKVYSLVQKFRKKLPWLRENFLSILKARSMIQQPSSLNDNNISFTFDIEGVISDVLVQVKKCSPYQQQQQHINNITVSHDETIKGRHLF